MTNEELIKALTNAHISCTPDQLATLESFQGAVLEMNQKFNLTAIKEPDEFREKMIFDSAVLLSYLSLDHQSIIDLGTGAGFPSVVLAILSNGEVTALDATKKKIDFVSSYATTHQIALKTVCDRAEHYAKAHPESYDFVVARAVSSLPVLLELAMPLLKVGGTFIALKGPNADSEITESRKALGKLNATIVRKESFTLPLCQEKRNILFIKKEKKTNPKYPRDYSEIVSRPL